MIQNLYYSETGLAVYDKKRNTVFIKSDIISPDVRRLSWREAFKEQDRAQAMSYHERLNKWAAKEQRIEVEKLIAEHDGCLISEFC